MSGRAWLGGVGGGSLTNGVVTRYLPVVGQISNGIDAFASTEAHTQLKLRTAANLLNFYMTVSSNSRVTATDFTLRKNGADTSVVIAIGAGVTGVFSDTSNSVSFADGDTVCVKMVSGTGSAIQGLTINSISIEVRKVGQAEIYFGLAPTGAGISASADSTTNAYSIGDETGTTTGNEARCNVRAMESCTLSNLQVYVSANARTTDTTFSSRKNSAAGAMSCVFGSGITGLIEDTTNSDSLVAGDRYNFARATLTAGGAIVFRMIAIKYVGVSANTAPLSSGGTSETLSAGVTRYCGPVGTMAPNSAENARQVASPAKGTAANAGIYVGANASTTDVTMTFRVAAVDTSVVVTVAATTTGSFVDTTNSATVAAGDYLSWAAAGATTGAVTFGSATVLFTAQPLGGTLRAPNYFAVPLLIR